MGNFDKIMRENLGGLSKRLLASFIPIEVRKIIPVPPRIRKTIIEREADNLFLIKTVELQDFILHLEFQSTNDSEMPLRTAVYNYMTQYAYKIEVMSVVVYLGKERMNMKNTLSSNGSVFTFKLVDIRDMDPALFLESRNPKELILAVLAGSDEKKRKLIIKQIIDKLPLLTKTESRLTELLVQLEIISLLRGKNIQQFVIKQKEIMPIIIDIRQDLRYQQGIKEATSERNTAIVKNLLQYTDHSVNQIAKLVNVSTAFVLRIKKSCK